jgi:tRNA(Ile)-lysidine synthase
VSVGDQLLASLRAGLGSPVGPVAVAVSGGGDSVALLHLMVALRTNGGPALHAVTMNHRLRPEAAQEAAGVAALCRKLDVPHATLIWADAPQGNVMQAARAARYHGIAEWARATGIQTILLAHTRDDLAETFLMRLARGSGVDGLSAMAQSRQSNGVTWLRPLLDVSRATLRSYLHEIGATWVEDPTNDDPTYDRTRARHALGLLAPLGITADRIAETAALMALARDALDAACLAAEGTVWRTDHGDLLLNAGPFTALPMDTQLRLLAAGIRWVASAPYRPRLADLTRLHGAAITGDCRRTLMGCLITARGGTIRIGREPRAVAGLTGQTGTPWDGRWHLHGPTATVRALDAPGVAALRTLGALPRHIPLATLLASPAIWDQDTLIAAPLAGLSNGYSAEIRPSFTAALMAH